jgi:hypothetical protein
LAKDLVPHDWRIIEGLRLVEAEKARTN